MPEFMATFLEHEDTYLSYYNEERNEELKSLAVQQNQETYSCVTQGEEIYRLVSPVFKQNMYSGVRDELKPHQSPVDLFHQNAT